MKTWILAIAAVCAAGADGAGRPFSLYQSIIDRQPFGDGPDDPSIPPENAPRDARGGAAGKTEDEVAREQQQLERAVALHAIHIKPDGEVMAGFSDMSDPKAPRHFYMSKGQEKGGWLLKEADPVEKKVVLVKDGIEIERTIGAAAAAASGKNAGGGAAASRRGLSGVRGRAGAAGALQTAEGSGLRSHRALKRERDEADRRARQEMIEAQRKRQEEEELRREEERAQREAENEATRQNLQNMAEELRRMREENRRQKEEAERAAAAKAQAETNDNP